MRSSSPTSAAPTRMKRCTSQLANQPMQNATNSTMAVAMINSVLFIRGLVLLGLVRVLPFFPRILEAFKRCLLLNHRLGSDNLEFDAAVDLAALLGTVIGNRSALAIPLGLDGRGQHAPQPQFVEHRARPLKAQLSVHFLAALAVGMAADLHLELAALLQDFGDLIHDRRAL